MNAHFHLHSLVPAGVLSLDGKQWIDCKYNYLFPAAALSKKFRGKFMAYFEEAFKKKKLKFPGQTVIYGTPHGFKTLKNRLWSKQWVVDIEDPIDRGD